MESCQIDLVVMESSHSTDMFGNVYRYILSVLHVFSRFVFLFPLENKESSEVAQHLISIFNVFGKSKLLQTDGGSEFRGEEVLTVYYSIDLIIHLSIGIYSNLIQTNEKKGK